MVPRTSGKILSDVGVDEIGSAGLEVDEGIANVGFAFTQGLDFGTMKDKSRFHFFENVIIIRSGTILSDNLICCRFRVLRPLWTLLRSLIWLCHNLSFYLMARLSERTGNTTLPGNTQPPGRNPSQGEDCMTGRKAGSFIGSILEMFTFIWGTCSRMSGSRCAVTGRLTGTWAGGVTGTQDSMELEAC